MYPIINKISSLSMLVAIWQSMATATFELPIFYLFSYHVVTYLLFNGFQIISNGALDSYSGTVISKERVIPSHSVASFNYKMYSGQSKWLARSFLLLQRTELDFARDLTICIDVESNPGDLTLIWLDLNAYGEIETA